MPNKVEAGKNYKCIRQRSGSSTRGPWEFVTCVDERGKNEITLFVTNIPSGVRENQKFKVLKISAISLGVKRGTDEKWYPSYTADVEIEPIPEEFSEFDGGDDANLPWSSEDYELPL